MEIGTRLSSALTTINIKNKDLVDVFKISQQYASSIKKADKINDTIAKIANHYDININWLMSGRGDMFVQNDSQTNNLQNSNIAGTGVDNSQGSSHKFNQNSASASFVPDFLINDINNVFQRANSLNKIEELSDAFDDFIYQQKKKMR